MIYRKILSVTFVCLLLSGCANLSKEECLNADWYEIGYNDGVEGKKRSRLNNHIKACAEYHVSAQTQPYFKGREKGLKSYCTVENALQIGLRGYSYNHVCPSHIESAFLKKYRQGKTIYNLEQEINNHESEISTLEHKLKKKKDKLSKKEKREIKREIEHLEIRIEEKTKQLYYLKGQAGV